jgi:hypothetical protein
VYTSVYQNKFEEVKKRREGKVVKPSEIEEIKEGQMYRLRSTERLTFHNKAKWSAGKKD